MAPTERSMPAVRMISVCAIADDADDRDLLQDQGEIERVEEAAADERRENTTMPSSSTMNGNGGRIGVQEMLQPLERRRRLFLERRSRASLGGAQPRSPQATLARASFMMLDCPDRPPRWQAASPTRPSLQPRDVRAAHQPQHFQAFLGGDRRTPSTGLSVMSFDAGVEEVEAWGVLGLLAGLGELDDRLHAHRRHQQRDTAARWRRSRPALTFLTPGQPPSTETISTLLVLAGRLQRLVGAGRGRLVDGVDDVDVGVLLQQVLHRLAAAFLVAARHVVADDRADRPRRRSAWDP